MKKILLPFFLLLICVYSRAYDVEIDGIYYNLNKPYSGAAEVTCLNSSNNESAYVGDVVIPESILHNGKTYAVASIGNGAFKKCAKLISVSIPNSIYRIGEESIFADYPFGDCTGLVAITIPASMEEIRDYSFHGCENLTSVFINSNYILSKNYEDDIRSIATFFGKQVKTYTLGDEVKSIGAYVFQRCDSLTSLIIGKSVTRIDDNAFKSYSSILHNECKSLTSVTINSNSIASLSYLSSYFGKQVEKYILGEEVTSIGDHAFAGCESMNDIIFSGIITSIGNYAFDGCSNLTTVIIPNGVTAIGYSAFAGCSSLTALTIPNSVTSIGDYAFEKCSSITAVTIPNGVTTIGYSAFAGCSSLTALTIPNSVTSIGDYAFRECNSLTSLNLDCNTVGSWFSNKSIKEVTFGENVTSIGDGAFQYCYSLSSITFGSRITSIGAYSFSGCAGLSSLSLPEHLISIGNGAFRACSGLNSVVISENVAQMGRGAFAECSGLTSLRVKEDNLTYDSRNGCNAIIETATNRLIQGCNYTSIPQDVTRISDAAFYGCSDLTSVSLPNGLLSIGDDAFADCSGLTAINIPSSITEIGSDAFQGCEGLTRAEFASIEHLCTIKFKHEFHYGTNPLCYAKHLYVAGREVTDITIPESVDSIGDYVFSGGSYITSVFVPGNVKSIGCETFEGCSSLCSIIISEGVSSIGYGAFRDCVSLVDLKFPASLRRIGQFAFEGCSNLSRVDYSSIKCLCEMDFDDSESNPLSRTHHLYIDGEEIKDVVIPEGVESIGSYAFNEAKYITSATIPSTVTSIGACAFEGCSNLSTVMSKASKPVIQWAAFNGIASNAILSIPPFSEDAYSYDNCLTYFDQWTSDIKMDGLYFNLDDDGDGAAWVEYPILEKKPYGDNVVIPSAITYEGVEYPVAGIDDEAFKDAKITSIVIPDGVRYIDEGAFYNCENLIFISIPKTVRSIGASAFMYCDDVETLICNVKNPFPIQGKGDEGATFSNYFFNNVPLYVPKGTIEEYRNTEGWKDFVNIVDGIPTGITEIVNNESNDEERFDVGGRRILHEQRGLNIIRNANGSVRKVIVVK
ncbi:MAG: leucine-rich repeat domain-containing protein [Bacteroidaceae bacterium]|nr:leucine-rich repeat domain-containing protein [Bacteroidaceae bacterium]